MTRRENFLRAARFECPDAIPMTFIVNGSCWRHYPHEALIELMATHPYLFPGFKPEEFTPPVFDALVRREVELLGGKQGGLMMIHGVYPGVPLENIRALMDAMERYAGYYA